MAKFVLTKDFIIPKEGITEEFELNAYATFSMCIIDLVYKNEKDSLKILNIEKSIYDKEIEEDIQIRGLDNKDTKSAKIKIKKKVLSYTGTIDVYKLINRDKKSEFDPLLKKGLNRKPIQLPDEEMNKLKKEVI